MFRGKPLRGLLCALLVSVGDARAEDLGAKSLGRAGVGVADGLDTAAAADHAAAVSLEEVYDVTAGAGLGADRAVLVRGAAVDSRSSVVTLALGYTRLTDDAEPAVADLPGWRPEGVTLEDPTEHQSVRAGLAYPFAGRRLSVALHPRFDWRSSALTGDTSAFNFGASVAGRPLPTLTVAAAAWNLLENDYRDTERTLALGARWQPGTFLGVEGDVLAPLTDDWAWTRTDWRAGLDVGVVEWLVLRAGYASDDAIDHLGVGLGFQSPEASVDYGARVRLDQPSRNWHEIQLTVHF